MNKVVRYLFCLSFLLSFVSVSSVHGMQDTPAGAQVEVFAVGPRPNLFVPIPVYLNVLGRRILEIARRSCEVVCVGQELRDGEELMAHTRTGTDNLVFELGKLSRLIGFAQEPRFRITRIPYVIILKKHGFHQDPELGELLYDLKQAYNRRISGVSQLELSERERDRLAAIEAHLRDYTIPGPGGVVYRPYGRID